MARSYDHLKAKTRVYDRGRPYRYGVIVKRLKTVLDVQWTDGQIDRYDTPHMQFLEVIPRRPVGRA